MNINILVIGVGIAVFFLLAVFFSLCGFRVYNQSFGPNFASAIVGGALGASISLVVVLIGFVLQRDSRNKSLEPGRYLFLREQGEELKESYIAFIDALRIGGQNSLDLSAKSWQALQKEAWPDTKSIDLVQNNIKQKRLSDSYSSQAIVEKYHRLRQSVEAIVRMSALGVFENEESLIGGVLWDVDYKIHSIGVTLSQITTKQPDVNLSAIEKSLKDILIATGELLKNLCKLGKDIKLK